MTSPGKSVKILAGKGDDFRDGINHLAGARLLFHFAILPERDWQDRLTSTSV